MAEDAIGVYDEDEMPPQLTLPVHINEFNGSLDGDDNVTHFQFAFTRETVKVVQARRVAAFVARVMNGELRIERNPKTGAVSVVKGSAYVKPAESEIDEPKQEIEATAKVPEKKKPGRKPKEYK